MSRHRLSRIALLSAVLAPGASAQAQLPEWRVSARPIVTLDDNGTPSREFHRISGAWRLSNGNVVVANGGSMELRVFDEQGALVETFGRRGKGPGEFEAIHVIDIAGDTAFIYDRTARRVSAVRFGGKTAVVGSVTILATGSKDGFQIDGRLGDGRWVATQGSGTPGGWDAPKGVTRAKTIVGLVGRDGTGTIREIAEALSMASITYMPSSDKSKWVTGPAAFSPWFVGVSSAGAFWFGDTSTDSLVRLDRSGNARRVAVPLTPVPLTPQMIAAAKEPDVAAARRGGSTEYTDFRYSAENLPKVLPHHGGVIAGTDGGVWVLEYPPLPTSVPRYLVLDAYGRPIARIAVPAGFRATQAGRDFIVGTTRDADGLEGVKVLRIERR